MHSTDSSVTVLVSLPPPAVMVPDIDCSTPASANPEFTLAITLLLMVTDPDAVTVVFDPLVCLILYLCWTSPGVQLFKFAL